MIGNRGSIERYSYACLATANCNDFDFDTVNYILLYVITYHSIAEGNGHSTGRIRVDLSTVETSPNLVVVIVVGLSAKSLIGPRMCYL